MRSRITAIIRTRSTGTSSATAQAAGRKDEDDDEQLAYAVNQHQTLLTHNRDHFVALAQEYFTAGRKHYGIIIAVRRPPHEIVRRLLPILNQIIGNYVSAIATMPQRRCAVRNAAFSALLSLLSPKAQPPKRGNLFSSINFYCCASGNTSVVAGVMTL
ncbi:MAG: DUF5615 family PIN-like protein [Pyrinomonadaceae bacterium]